MGKGTNKVEIDLMQPIDPERAPKVHVPTLNHIGLWVDDLHKAVDELTAKDVRFTPGGIRKGAGERFCRSFLSLSLDLTRCGIMICASQLDTRWRSSTPSRRRACWWSSCRRQRTSSRRCRRCNRRAGM